MSRWSFFTGAIAFDDLCAACRRSLRLEMGHVIVFDQRPYHLSCLMDQLTAVTPPGSITLSGSITVTPGGQINWLAP